MIKGRFHFPSIRSLIYIPFILYFLLIIAVLSDYISAKRIRESAIENFLEIEEEYFRKTIVDYLNFHGMERDLSRLKNEFSQKIKLEKVHIINSSGLVVSSSEKSDLQSQILDSRIINALKEGKGERIPLRRKKGERKYLSVVPLKNNQLCFKCHEMKKKNTGAILLNFVVYENSEKGDGPYSILLIPLISLPLPLLSFLILKKKLITPIRNFKSKRELKNIAGDGIGKIINYATFLEERTHQQRIELSFLKQKISEIKNELSNTYERLVHSEKLASIGTLLAGLSHEINNPVGTIISRCDCLILEAEQRKLPPEVIEDLKTIRFHAMRISNLIYTLLNFSRISSDERKECNINGIIESALVLVEPQFKKEGIKIIKRLMFGLPKVLANEIQLQQVFLNILNNAREAISKEGEIIIESQAPLHDEKFVKVIISDNGKGIPQEHIKRIYEPFFTTKKSGTGLGLFLCYNIVRTHGGEMEINSEEGKGTTVVIKLPFIERNM